MPEATQRLFLFPVRVTVGGACCACAVWLTNEVKGVKEEEVFVENTHFFEKLVENESGVTSLNDHQSTERILTPLLLKINNQNMRKT